MTRFTVRPLLFVLFACVAIGTQPAWAVVNTNGDVRPSATPFGVIFTDDDNDFFSDVISPEGNTVAEDLADPFDPTGGNGNGLPWDDEIIWRNYESRQNILVGETASGSLTINGGSDLRYQHLILGGASTDTNGELILTADPAAAGFDLQKALDSKDELSSGYGVMTVTGFGSVFNNDPQVIETQYSTALLEAGVMGPVPAVPDPGARILSEGFDVYVGLSGSGELNVMAGGHVEIQDSLVVALGQSATGTVNINGGGSHLMAFGRDDFDPSAANNASTSTNADIGSVIGGFGHGSLNITEGGRGSFFNGLSLGTSNGNMGTNIAGGSGTVVVEGTGSTLAVYTSSVISDGTAPVALAIGGISTTSTGTGLLRIGEGGLVNVTFDASYTNSSLDRAKAIIGSAGKIEMQGGRLNVGDALVNDGDLRGYGIITSGKFYNGSTSSLVVGEGEYLSIRSSGAANDEVSGFDPTTSIEIHTDSDNDGDIDNGPADYIQANLGSIRVTGGELELGRVVSTDPTAAVDRTEAFQNTRYATFDDSNPYVAGPPVTGSGSVIEDTVIGTITSQDGTLNFKSGLYNTGVIAFTGGDNTVVGNVLNGSFDYDPANDSVVAPGFVNNQLIIPGVILVSGDATTVTFTDNVDNEGIISVGPTNTVANFLGDLNNSGVLQVAVDPLGNFARSAAIVVGQDVTINSGSTIIVNFISAAPVAPGFSVALLTAGGALDEASLFSNLVLPDLPEGQFWDVIYDTALDQVRLEIIESLALGGDFSGDGVVNSADIAIWVANVGILSGASAIQGDADLDGDVDQNDYLVLMEQIFTGVPVLVGGSGGTPIPEPSTALLALLASAALVSRRR